MNIRGLISSLALSAVLLPPGLAADPQPPAVPNGEQLYQEILAEAAVLEKQGSLLKKVVQLATPSVVHIQTIKTNQVSYNRRTRGEEGSGVVIRIGSGLYVLTNRHVVDEASLANINVRLANGRLLHPVNVISDRRTDVAILSVTGDDLTFAHLGDSNRVDIGDFVLAVGSPFGLSHSVTYGIISAKGRRDLELGDGSIRYQDFLQTDAAINPGNSGGPLFNLRGEVIGINTAIASSSGGSEGIGFTIPINMAMTVAQQLIEQGRTSRAYLGVRLNDDFSETDAARLGLSHPQGAMVTGITADTPAAKAALQIDDVIIEFDGHRIDDDEHLIQVVGFTAIGKAVDLVVLRRGKTVRLQVTLEDRSRYESDG
jgi:serine protease Do